MERGPGGEATDLYHAWKLRNSLAAALELALDDMARQVQDASLEALIDFAGSFSPARAAGPERVASFDRFVELVWECVDAERIAALEAEFRTRGPLWAALANSFTPERGASLQAARYQPRGSRRPAVVLR